MTRPKEESTQFRMSMVAYGVTAICLTATMWIAVSTDDIWIAALVCIAAVAIGSGKIRSDPES